jgi:hypothetical protein
MQPISDIDHMKLEATIQPNCIVEKHKISDAARGWRGRTVENVWRTERVLGRGGFGEVHLQALDDDKEKKRALKIIRGEQTAREYLRELKAMIEFSKPKVLKLRSFEEFLKFTNRKNSTELWVILLNLWAGSRIQMRIYCIWLWNICLVEISRRTF